MEVCEKVYLSYLAGLFKCVVMFEIVYLREENIFEWLIRKKF